VCARASAPAAGISVLRQYRGDILAVLALLLLASLAFAHLMALPVFADEASQLRLVWRVIDAGEWLQPLGEGKPLEAWPLVPLVRLGLHPLTVARAVHVVAGMIGAVLTYRLARQLSDRTSAFISGGLFAICPFVVYLQRLALADMFMCVAGIWVLASIIAFIASPTWRHTFVVAMALVVAALSKLPVGFVFLISMPMALVLMPAPERRRLLAAPDLAKVLAAHAPATLVALLVLGVAALRMRRGQSPGFGLQDLLGVGMGHYPGIAASMGVPRPRLFDELAAQLSWPVTAIGLLGLAFSAFANDWRRRWLLVMGAAPMLAIGFLADFWFSRYLLFTLPPLIVCAVCGWQSLPLRSKAIRLPLELTALAVCVGFMGSQSAWIVFDPSSANWSRVDRFQYFEAPGSGFGFPEAARFVLESPAAPRMIYSLDGYSAQQLLTYLPANWRGRVKPIYYGDDGQPLRTDAARLENLLKRTPVWLIVPEQLLPGDLASNFGRLKPDQIKLRQIAAFDKPGLHARLAIYEVVGR
jgi:4-amino-4-deoxy-L-arabinose transferase-like glycosyltransferase